MPEATRGNTLLVWPRDTRSSTWDRGNTSNPELGVAANSITVLAHG